MQAYSIALPNIWRSVIVDMHKKLIRSSPVICPSTVAFHGACSTQIIDYQFLVVSIVITGITLALASYTAIRAMNHQLIFGEILVLAGSCSNLIDRFIYGGVVDFILLSYGDWSFPVFNCADVCIVIGIGLMLFEQYGES